MARLDGVKPVRPVGDVPRRPSKKTYYHEDEEEVFSEIISSPELVEAHKRFVGRFHRTISNFKKIIANFFIYPFKIFGFHSELGLKKNSSRKKKSNVKPLFSFKVLCLFAVFICIGMVLALALGSTKVKAERLTDQVQESVDRSFALIESGDMPGALKEAEKAKNDILELKILLQSWGQDIGYLKTTPFVDSKLSANERLLDATFIIVDTVSSLNQEFSKLSPPPENDANFTTKGSGLILNISKSQEVLMRLVDDCSQKLTYSRSQLNKIDKSLGPETQEKVDRAISTINKTLESINFTETLVKNDLTWLSGADGQSKRILILFQNNSELRGGSGGSLGSFGIANFTDGKLESIDFGKNIFKLDKAFESSNMITPPSVIKFLRGDKSWTMKDSGWALDGEESMKNIVDFYQKETSEKVDGVFMVDTTAITSLLKIMGPIEMTQYQKTITDQNFRSEIDYEVHKGYWDKEGNEVENEPKKIISDMMPIFLSRLFDGLSSKDQSTKIFDSFSKSLKQKDLMFYFTKQDFQSRINNLNYGGKIVPSVGDYLYVNNSNIDGAKSSLNVSEDLSVKVTIKSSGEVNNTLEIKRKHNGTGEWPDGDNKNFTRVLVPDNSALISFSPVNGNFQQMMNQGFKDGNPYWVEKEAQKSSINFWMSTKPKEESAVRIDYKPNYMLKVDDDFVYSITLQKQPGANPDKASLQVGYPSNFKPTNVTNFDQANNSLTLNLTVDHDQTIKIRFKKIK